MKLRNKKTGEIVEDGYVRETHDFQFDGQKHVLAVFNGNGHRPPARVSGAYTSLAELNEEWEDYEEPKVGYMIDHMEEDCVSADDDSGYDESDIERAKELGLWFESEEEAERAVEKLKAYKRLRDKGFRFGGVSLINQAINYRLYDENDYLTAEEFKKASNEFYKDLDLLFGGEE